MLLHDVAAGMSFLHGRWARCHVSPSYRLRHNDAACLTLAHVHVAPAPQGAPVLAMHASQHREQAHCVLHWPEYGNTDSLCGTQGLRAR